jgi:hypothetical protein
MFTRALCIATLAIALGTAFAATGASAQNPSPANRLALVVGEAAYSGDALPTAAADAALVAQSLAAAGFDVTELHDLGAADLASQYQAFVAKVAAAPAGAAVTVYLAGLGVAVGCDDYLLPVDARIATEADAPRVALSMTRVMNDLAQTPSQLRLVMLDGARPIPGSVSAVAFPRGLIPLHPPGATTFGLSAEIHDFEAPPKPGDANDAYAPAFASAAQLPLTDLESVMRETRVIAHQATAGAQTPWQETNPSAPPFTFPLAADPAQVEAAVAALPNSTTSIAELDPESAYWAAVWRNAIPDYQAYLAAFGATATPERKAIVENLLSLLQQPNPQCEASAAPPPPPAIVTGPACPDGFYAQGGYVDAYCAPLVPPPALVCPAGFVSVVTDDGLACGPFAPPPVLICPPRFHPVGGRFCAPNVPPPFCPPGFRPTWRDGALVCVRLGPPPPICPFGTHPTWNGAGYVCGGNPPPPPPCSNGRPNWLNGQWGCLPPPPPSCPPGLTPLWSNGKSNCGAPRPPIGPSPCPPGFIPPRIAGQACIPAPKPMPTLAPPIVRPTLSPGPRPILPTLAPRPSPTLTLPHTPLPGLEPRPTPSPTLTLPQTLPPRPKATPLLKLTPNPAPTVTAPKVIPRPQFTPTPRVGPQPKFTPAAPRTFRAEPPKPRPEPNGRAHCGGPGQPRCP